MREDDQNNDEEPIPDGMVRKRRRVRKRRSSSPERSSGKEEANRLFAKAKELLIGMHDEDEDFFHCLVRHTHVCKHWHCKTTVQEAYISKSQSNVHLSLTPLMRASSH